MSSGRRLLLEAEAAEILRCSTSKVKRLRFAGKLAYIPGRPVLIDIEDLNCYIEGVKNRAIEKAAAEAGKKSPQRMAREGWLKYNARRGTLSRVNFK